MIQKLVLRDKNHIDEVVMLLIPIRCFSCGKPIGHLWEEYSEKIKAGEERKKVLDELGLKRYCCRAMLLGHVDLIDDAAVFKKF